MGGTIFLREINKESVRMPKDLYLQLEQELIDILNSLNIKSSKIQFIKDKSDFGDIDILVIDDRSDENRKINNTSPLALIRENIDKFDIPEEYCARNGDVLSILYKGKYQVDFIKANSETAEYHKCYLSHNDLGNLLGRMSKRFNLKHGHDGLYYQHYNLQRTSKTEIKLSTDPYELLNLLNLDVEKFKNGFNSYTDMFDFVINCKYFKKSVFQYENLNNKNRVRDKKRKVYNLFLEYIKDKEFTNESNIIEPFKIYPGLEENLNNILKDIEIKKDKKDRLKGNKIMELVPLSGPELGQFIARMLERYDAVLLDLTDSEIVELVKAEYIAMT